MIRLATHGSNVKKPALVDGVHKSRSNRRYVRNLSSRRYAVFFPAFTRAHLALCAAAIFLRAAADSVRLPRIGTTFAVARTLAHRALWAAAILARPAADIFLLPVPFPDAEPRAASAAPIRRSSLARRSRSCSNNWTTPDKLDIGSPSRVIVANYFPRPSVSKVDLGLGWLMRL